MRSSYRAEAEDTFKSYNLGVRLVRNASDREQREIRIKLLDNNFSNKIIIPFCSHGGGRFGQSITAISKLAPNSKIGKGLSIHYSGGNTLSSDVNKWLVENKL